MYTLNGKGYLLMENTNETGKGYFETMQSLIIGRFQENEKDLLERFVFGKMLGMLHANGGKCAGGTIPPEDCLNNWVDLKYYLVDELMTAIENYSVGSTLREDDFRRLEGIWGKIGETYVDSCISVLSLVLCVEECWEEDRETILFGVDQEKYLRMHWDLFVEFIRDCSRKGNFSAGTVYMVAFAYTVLLRGGFVGSPVARDGLGEILRECGDGNCSEEIRDCENMLSYIG